MDRALTWFANAWVALALVLLASKVIVAGLAAPNWWGAVAAMISTTWDVFDPFNISHFVAELIFLSPAFGAFLWREKRRATTLKGH